VYVGEADFMNMKATLKPRTVRQVIKWKNPDIHPRLRKWGEFQEYFTAEIIIDPRTGEGTIKLIP
jgi:predicted metal-dependent hydrolase